MSGSEASSGEATAAIAEFKQAVNMSAKTLAAWLTTADSESVGFKASKGAESVGHDSGKQIVMLLNKPPADFTGHHLAYARKVVGYVRRHLAQLPDGDTSETRWRYALMNWGHDPQKGS